MISQTISHYRILDRLGAGGMGEVYLAQDTKLDRKVAIKLLPAELAEDSRARRRLIGEARAAAKLDHPNICTIHEVEEENGHCFIVMQYVDGETLSSKAARTPLELREALGIAIQISEALSEAHSRGIIHRDIKPQNIMITARGQAKVMDFGLAKMLPEVALEESHAETALTEPGMIVGTIPYMSPDQLHGEDLDGRSDIFSFGSLLYEMFSGRQPFTGRGTASIISAILTQEPPSLLAKVPEEVERIVMRCLEKDRERRYQTMHDLTLDLRRVNSECESGRLTVRCDEPATLQRPAVTTDRDITWQSLVAHNRKALAVGLFILIAVAIAYGLFIRGSSSPPRADVRQVSTEASDYYVRGKVNVSNENRDNNDAAIKLLEQAVAADPNLAPAYAELARAYNIKAFYFAPEAERKELNENAAVAAEKSLYLDPNMAEGHFARGLILWTHANRFPHEQAIEEYRRALALNSKLDDVHHQLGLVYLHIGLLDKGWEEIERAVEINPGNMPARFRFGVIDLYRGKYEEALKVFNRTPLEKNPSMWGVQTATALFQLGRNEEAKRLVAQYLKDYPKDEGGLGTSVKAMILARTGHKTEAGDAIKRAEDIGKGFGHFHHTAYNIASAYALMNEPEDAVKWLQVAADDGFPCYPLFETDANLNSLRNEKHFIEFMAKLKQQWETYKATL